MGYRLFDCEAATTKKIDCLIVAPSTAPAEMEAKCAEDVVETQLFLASHVTALECKHCSQR